MKIKLLGTRGEIEETAPYHSRKSGILIDDTLLIDCGQKEFLQYNPKAILITHLHPDHAYFVRHKETPEIHVPIYAPEKYPGLPIIVTNKPFTIAGYHITPIPTVHSIKVVSNSYSIEYNGKKILYTGDLIWIEKKYRHLLTQYDAIITEASFKDTGGLVRRDTKTAKIFGHTGIPNLIKLFKEFTDTIIFIHFGSWFYQDIAKARKFFKKLSKENAINCIVGYDGLEIKI